MKLRQLASGQCFSVRPYAETGFNSARYESVNYLKVTRYRCSHV